MITLSANRKIYMSSDNCIFCRKYFELISAHVNHMSRPTAKAFLAQLFRELERKLNKISHGELVWNDKKKRWCFYTSFLPDIAIMRMVFFSDGSTGWVEVTIDRYNAAMNKFITRLFQ